jgi:hypothetical protein
MLQIILHGKCAILIFKANLNEMIKDHLKFIIDYSLNKTI